MELGRAALLELEKRRCAVDPAYWLEHWVVTKDEADAVNPFKRFPAPGSKPHLYLLVDRWLRYPLLLVPKSRRMMCTWTFLLLYGWDSAFHDGRHNFVGSKKEDDAGFLLDKLEFVFEPMVEKGLLSPYKRKREPHLIEFKERHSLIQGIASGPDQLRQYTASGLLLDEVAFHQDLKATLGACMATILGGGRATLVSSVLAGSDFQDLVHGTADDLVEAA